MKYKLVCFDVDGTLVDDTIYIWKTLHEHYGTDEEEILKMLGKYLNKEVTYQEWVDHDVSLLQQKGATKEEMVGIIQKLKLMKGAKEAVNELKKTGLKLAVVSGSLGLVLDILFPDHPFDDVLINQFEFDEDGKLVRGVATPYDMEHKASGLKHLAERYGFNLSECIFVGDNNNDIHIAETAGLSIAFNCKSERLAEIADVLIPNDIKDVRAILPHILEK
ncbi:MAG: HAD family phosphatase [Nanoarchaeota archaeon]|nr:HAD family phosphatase [Nanoarchaeota archaeon]